MKGGFRVADLFCLTSVEVGVQNVVLNTGDNGYVSNTTPNFATSHAPVLVQCP